VGGEDDFLTDPDRNEALEDTVLEEKHRTQVIHLAGKLARSPLIQSAARAYLREVVRVARTFGKGKKTTIEASESAADLGVTWAIDDWKREGR
jgi:hypothetical protein